MNFQNARTTLNQMLAEAADPYDEQSVTIGLVDGAEVCLMGWRDRPIKDIRTVPTHANPADCLQMVLEGGMDVYYPDEQRTVILRRGDSHVVPGGRVHACVSHQRSIVLVVVGHRAGAAQMTTPEVPHEH